MFKYSCTMKRSFTFLWAYSSHWGFLGKDYLCPLLNPRDRYSPGTLTPNGFVMLFCSIYKPRMSMMSFLLKPQSDFFHGSESICQFLFNRVLLEDFLEIFYPFGELGGTSVTSNLKGLFVDNFRSRKWNPLLKLHGMTHLIVNKLNP